MTLRRRFLAARDGATVIEFALVAPVFLLMVCGVFDLGQMLYARALLSGAMEQSARASAVEDADTSTLDAQVKAAVRPIIPAATFTFTRTAYNDFTDVGRAEKFTDTNADGTCDNKEAYIDENGNGHWDADIGETGNGSADDIILYVATATYTPFFYVPLLPSSANAVTITGKTVRKNQPFTAQTDYSTTTGTCA